MRNCDKFTLCNQPKRFFCLCPDEFLFGILTVLAVLLLGGGQTFAQTGIEKPKKINFGYSKNPETKPKKTTENQIASPEIQPAEQPPENTIAKKTLEIAKKSIGKNLPPTEVYRVGVGDVLFVSLQNAPARDSTYFTVLNDGTIDYPLAGEMVSVSGLTTDEIEEALREKIKLYENPQISVRVRDYASHRITVLGLVEKPGEKFIQREAVPLFVVKAEAIVRAGAGQVTIRRSDASAQIFDLKDAKTDETLVTAGDIVEFSAGASGIDSQIPQYYFIGGNILTGGQKDFHSGLSLSQAILAAGGLRKPNVKTVVIRRKNAEGLLISITYNLREIKEGKIPDPLLTAGDTIEVGN